MALRKRIKEFQERKRRYFLVFWPDEDSYSEVPESKIVGNPGSLGEAIQVKERQKVYTGVLVAVGSKQEVQEKLRNIEEPVISTNSPESVTATTPAAPIVTVTPTAPTSVATTHAPSTTPPSPMTVATSNAPSMTPAGPINVATTNETGTTPAASAASAESNPKMSKKQGRKRKIPTEKVATGQKNGSEKPPKKRQKKEAGAIIYVVPYDETRPSAASATVGTTNTTPTTSSTAAATPASVTLAITSAPATTPAAVTVTPAAPTIVATSSAPSTTPAAVTVTPAAPTIVATSSAPSTTPAAVTVTPAAPTIVATSSAPSTTPAAPITVATISDGSISSVSTVPPLPPPIANLHSSIASLTRSQSINSLTLEMEVQDLVDRVTTTEANYALILQKQDEILSRLDSLEKHPAVPQASTPYRSFFQDYDDTESFSFIDNSHLPVDTPPPPPHPPQQRFILAEHYESFENQTPLRPRIPFQPPSLHPPSSHPRPSHLPSSHPPPSHPLPPHPPPREDQMQPRTPFQPITNQTYQSDNAISQNAVATKKANPIRIKPANSTLPSSVINQQKLISASDVIAKHPKLRCSSKVGTMAVKLAKDAFFGEEVMARCTVAGERELPGLPTDELRCLKHTIFMLFPEYWNSPQEFEPQWKVCTDAIDQACKRYRTKNR